MLKKNSIESMSTTYLGIIPSLNDTRVTRATTRDHVINMCHLLEPNYQTLSLTNFSNPKST